MPVSDRARSQGFFMLATAEDVRQCYRLILKRDPESDTVISMRLAKAPTLWQVVDDLLSSQERKVIENSGRALSLEKCLQSPVYLARSFSKQDGLLGCSHHMALLSEIVSYDHLSRIFYDKIELKRFSVADFDYSVALQTSRKITNEGDLTLKLSENGEKIYVLSFTFVPSHLVGGDVGTSVLISRMQGTIGRHESLRRATKACREIAPQSYLFAMLQGIAIASGIYDVYGVVSDNQVCFDEAYRDAFVRSYDQFYDESGFEASRAGFCRAQLPMRHKSVQSIVPWHRSRTRLKRQEKQAIVDAAHDKWTSLMRVQQRSPARDPAT